MILCKKCIDIINIDNSNIICNNCNKKSKYLHCNICNLHHDNLSSKYHCDGCKNHVNKDHFYCSICSLCYSNKKKHCNKCNKCVLITYDHCNKCNKCHNIGDCKIDKNNDKMINENCSYCKKDHDNLLSYCCECKKCVEYKNHCDECKKCHDEDQIHCKICKSKHYYFFNTYCNKCNKCFLSDHVHCSNCDESIKKKIYINELKIKTYLINMYSYIECQKVFDWCKGNRFDFFIPSIKTLVEYDGEQHFKQISSWNFELTKYKDDMKNKKSIENNYKLIRINYNDIKYDNKWKLKFKKEEYEINDNIIDLLIKNKNEYLEYQQNMLLKYENCNNKTEFVKTILLYSFLSNPKCIKL